MGTGTASVRVSEQRESGAGEETMVAIRISEANDVRVARAYAAALARAAGVADPGMVEQAVAEVGNNCLEHRDGPEPAVLKIGCRRGKVTVRAENVCAKRPSWQT